MIRGFRNCQGCVAPAATNRQQAPRLPVGPLLLRRNRSVFARHPTESSKNYRCSYKALKTLKTCRIYSHNWGGTLCGSFTFGKVYLEIGRASCRERVQI